MRKLIILFVLPFFTSQIFAIEINKNFGEISKEELLMKVYEKDSSAEALILFDIGKTHFQYSSENGFKMIFERQVRIKIFNKDGFDYSNFSISLYGNNGNNEKLSNIKAVTYNLENDKIIVTKLNKKDIYEIEATPNKNLKKFSLPSVREGSVIEVNYTIISDYFYNLQEWKFQNFIPTMWSEYTAEIPEYFNYNKIAKGYLSFDINEIKTENDIITYVIKSEKEFGKGYSEYEHRKVDFEKHITHIAVKNAPAMKKEAHMLAPDNYMSKIEFELAYTQFPNSLVKNYSQSWESINKELLDHIYFGEQLKNGNFLSEIIQSIQNENENPKEQVMQLYKFVINNYKWNDINALYASKSLRKTFIEKSGNSADLNLLMILLFKEAGFNAYPVILSTRDNELLNPVYPSVSQMNYVITLLKFEGQNILIDATDPYCLPGILPPKCINDKGRIINEQGTDWINIEPSGKYSTTVYGNFNITDKNIKGTLTKKLEGFASYNFRHKFNSFNNEKDYIADLESNNSGLKINEYKFENIDSLNKPILNKFTDITIESLDALGDIIYFNPLIIERVKENPFKLEKRNFPIDYNFLYNQKYIFNFTIPNGFVVEDMPKNEQLVLPEESLKYIYLIKNLGNTIQVTIQFDINKRQFQPEDYNFLKDFYNRIIAKESEQIVLKKI